MLVWKIMSTNMTFHYGRKLCRNTYNNHNKMYIMDRPSLSVILWPKKIYFRVDLCPASYVKRDAARTLRATQWYLL